MFQRHKTRVKKVKNIKNYASDTEYQDDKSI